jgi:uncharacterized membrane protein YhhN
LAVLACFVVAGVAVAALLGFERRGSRRGRYLAKPVASASFVALGAMGGPSWFLCGLALGAAGDLFLMLPGRRSFAAGLGLFFVGHVAYLVAIARALPVGEWSPAAALFPLCAAALALVHLWPHLATRTRLRAPLCLYAGLFALVVTGALSAAAAGVPGGRLLAAGALLFFASDFAVARHRFVAPSFANKLLGQPAYFSGQLLIAASTLE